ncbi:MAG: hypothetical protein AB7H86_14900 [Blastocatellales bacterium]
MQGKVAWNKAGSKAWSEGNIRNLCRGTINPSATIACFEAQIQSHDDWNRAITTCRTSANPVVEKPINQYTYLGSHNVVASYAYGYAFQNSQRYDVTTQLNGGVRMLEIDIVYDTPDDKQPAGVYVCHCGEAPHSYSKIELQRAKDRDMKSKIPLPVWSSGAKYIRFATILKQIDNWMVANPKEIVFIMPQNNSASVAQFDQEITAAGMKTGFYVKPASQRAWPTRSELVRANKRLLILASDGGDLSTSRYANSKSYTKWKGYITPKIYGSKNEYVPVAGEEDKFLVVGSFRSTPTDAITARYYNDYDELKKRKAEWDAKGYTRFPTFIQINQVQVGEALRFVNELNDSGYQVTGTVPKDPAGNWIVNASADIGSAFYSAGESIATYIEGEKIGAGQRGIKFNNQAGYVAQMTVIYYVSQTNNGVTLPIPKVLTTSKITAGFTRPLIIPHDVDRNMPIVVSIQGFGTFNDKVFSTSVPASFTGELCFKAWGTIFSPQGGKCNTN